MRAGRGSDASISIRSILFSAQRANGCGAPSSTSLFSSSLFFSFSVKKKKNHLSRRPRPPPLRGGQERHRSQHQQRRRLLPAALRLGRRDGRVPDRGRRARGRAWRLDLGHFLQKRRGHRRRLLPQVPRGHCLDEEDGRQQVQDVYRVAAHRSGRDGVLSRQRRGRRVLPQVDRRAARGRDRALGDDVSLGKTESILGERKKGKGMERKGCSLPLYLCFERPPALAASGEREGTKNEKKLKKKLQNSRQ